MATRNIFSKSRQIHTFLNPKSTNPSLRFKSTAALDVSQAKVPLSDPITENTRLRQNLALSYRLLDRENLNEGTCNHLTVMAPAKEGGGEVMLLVPAFLNNGGGLHWSKVTASCLIGLDESAKIVEGEGEPELTAACIHLGVRRVKKQAKVLMHVHPPWMSAMGCLQDPTLKMCHQNSARFLGRVAYDDEYNGAATELEEGERLGNKMGDKDVLIMCNHGALIAADNVHTAFDEIYYLERACQIQLLAQAAAGKDSLNIIKKEVAEITQKYIVRDLDKYAWKHFSAYWNKYVEEDSDVFM